MSTVGTTHVDSMMSYRDQGPEKAAENAETIAGDLVSCGFNTDLAPVADVWSNPENKVIGDRAYSDVFAQAAILVAAAVEGFHTGGVVCTLKHFPGHGDTATDSHTGAAYVTKTLDELKSEELLSFQAGIDAGALLDFSSPGKRVPCLRCREGTESPPEHFPRGFRERFLLRGNRLPHHIPIRIHHIYIS